MPELSRVEVVLRTGEVVGIAVESAFDPYDEGWAVQNTVAWHGGKMIGYLRTIRRTRPEVVGRTIYPAEESPCIESVRVASAKDGEEWRRKGIGFELYRVTAEHLAREGRVLLMGGPVEPEAKALWVKMEAEGLPVKTLPDGRKELDMRPLLVAREEATPRATRGIRC